MFYGQMIVLVYCDTNTNLNLFLNIAMVPLLCVASTLNLFNMFCLALLSES